MNERFSFELDEREVVVLATQIILNTCIKVHGIVPDFPSFSKPVLYDNRIEYSDDVLDMLIKGINAAVSGIFTRQHPGKDVVGMHLSSDVLERMIWNIFGAIKLAPIFEQEEIWTDFTLPPNFGEEASVVSHNRIATVAWEQLQETYDDLMKTYHSQLGKRYKLLEEFSAIQTSSEHEKLLLPLKKRCQEIADSRKEIICFCEQHGYKNPFSPPVEEEPTAFEQAVHWNEIHEHADITDSFGPSVAERRLFSFLPKEFEKHEWRLFQFRFTEDEEGEHDYMQGDMYSFREGQYERKMLIFYYAALHLCLHRQGIANMSSNLVESTRKHLAQLAGEIEDTQRAIMNGGDDPEKAELAHKDGNLVKYDIQRVQELATIAGNIIGTIHASTINVEVLKIIQRLTELLHAFYSSAVQIRTDDDLDNFDKKQIIQDLQESLLEELCLLQDKIVEMNYDDSSLDRADHVIQEAIGHLKQY